MKRHIIFACIYEYVCTMVMKKFTFLLITLFSSTLILLADNPYRSYTVADGLSNSTVKAIYQDEMGYIWLGTKDLSLIHISEPTRLGMISYAVFCLKKKKKR